MHKPPTLRAEAERAESTALERRGEPPRRIAYARAGVSPTSERRCSCGTLADYSPLYDAVFCQPCDRWLETRCSDKSCEFCAKRPRRPTLAPDLDPAPPVSSKKQQTPFNPPRVTPAKRGR